jgi:hypothetical protein
MENKKSQDEQGTQVIVRTRSRFDCRNSKLRKIKVSLTTGKLLLQPGTRGNYSRLSYQHSVLVEVARHGPVNSMEYLL